MNSPKEIPRSWASCSVAYAAILVPYSAVVPSPMPLGTAICRLLQGRRHNILLFLSVFLIGLIAVLRERE